MRKVLGWPGESRFLYQGMPKSNIKRALRALFGKSNPVKDTGLTAVKIDEDLIWLEDQAKRLGLDRPQEVYFNEWYRKQSKESK